jgi:V-type H+-transporting ATPase subunit C
MLRVDSLNKQAHLPYPPRRLRIIDLTPCVHRVGGVDRKSKPNIPSRAMAKSLWLISAPRTGGRTANDVMQTLSMRTGLCKAYKLDVPTFRIGNLDSLMSLADVLDREGMLAENIVNRVLNQFKELSPDETETPFVAVVGDRDVDALGYLTNFAWDEAKFASSDSLPDILALIKAQLDRMDEELKIRTSEYTATKQALSAIERNDKANLLQRNLATVVTADDVVQSEHMRTIFVVVNSYAEHEFLQKYESLADFVVPRSARKICAENEHILFGVTVLSKTVDQFKKKCRENRYNVREYTYEEGASDKRESEHDELTSQITVQREAFERWTETAYAETLIAMVHLKVVRVFVESVLRYGLPMDFTVTVVRPTGSEKRLRGELQNAFGHLSGPWTSRGGDDEMPTVPGVYVDKEIYPYVSLDVNLPKFSS